MSDTLVRCPKCGSEQRVDAATCLASGWPLCCRETMFLITTKDIGAATTKALRAQLPPARRPT